MTLICINALLGQFYLEKNQLLYMFNCFLDLEDVSFVAVSVLGSWLTWFSLALSDCSSIWNS